MRASLIFVLATMACRGGSKDTALFDPRDDLGDTGVEVSDPDDDPTDTEGGSDTDSSDTDSDTDTDEVMPEDADGDGFTADEDCDDDDPSIHPDAEEVCNGIDDDCDGLTDDDDDSVSGQETWYVDADGDGYGLGRDTVEACEQPSGYAERGGDCDDDDPAYHPGADEDDCTDPEDYNCDGSVGYVDADGDGFAACEDCDDGDADANPDGTETCDETDEDCDGDIDEDASDEPTWYIDYDSDGYGSDAYTLQQCDMPSGYVDNADDCDDTEELASPAGTEVCDEIDNDCDGDTDEDGASDASTWYADSDGDGYGDADDSTNACEQPSGYVSDDQDCDDDESLDNPDASERYDEADNDCDGDVDEDLWLGTGADGDLDVTSDFDLSTDSSGSRTEPDGATYVVTALSGDTVTVDVDADALAAGDEVLILNLHGSDSAYSNVGTYEFGWVDSVSGDEITLVDTLSETFGERSNSDLTDQAIFVVRVPQYEDVTLSDGAWLTTSPWDGETGGVVVFRATGTVFVEDGSAIVADELGYLGGATGSSYNCDAFQGESYAGEGDGEGDGSCSAYNENYGWWAANYGGGGAHITGGGGNHAGGATNGDSWTGGSATPPYAGDTYGDDELASMFPGSGGGGVWYGTSDPGPGGDGGGIVYIGADTIELEGAQAISALGGTTSHWATGSWTYGAGGGAGGTVWLVADTVDLSSDAITAEGGLGESSHTRIGGDGGYGRVRIDCNTCNGYSQGTSDAETELASAAEPDPGYSATPE